MAEKRTYNTHRIKATWPYEAQEIANLFGLHKNAVLQWLKNGLQADTTRRPYLIRGDELIRFLNDRQKRKKQKCAIDEFFCFKCHTLRKAYEGIADDDADGAFFLSFHTLVVFGKHFIVKRFFTFCHLEGVSQHNAVKRRVFAVCDAVIGFLDINGRNVIGQQQDFIGMEFVFVFPHKVGGFDHTTLQQAHDKGARAREGIKDMNVLVRKANTKLLTQGVIGTVDDEIHNLIRRIDDAKPFSHTGESRASIAITLFIKNPEAKQKAKLFYHDIGDYLSREEKLKIIADFESHKGMKWQKLKPNDSHDWINQRDPAFDRFMPIGDKVDGHSVAIFESYSSGLATSRDPWTYNFSKENLHSNMSRMISFYQDQVRAYHSLKAEKKTEIDAFIDTDPRKISWTRALKNGLERSSLKDFDAKSITVGTYRAFCKQRVYFDRYYSDMVSQLPKIFPEEGFGNIVISVCGVGVTKDFSVLINDTLVDRQLLANGQYFPLHTYEKVESLNLLSGLENAKDYRKQSNIPNEILTKFRAAYDDEITKEDIFYYVYGILHSPEYKARFAADLKKMLPRIPLAQDFWAFSKAGRDLAKWHLNYETIEPYPLDEQRQESKLPPKALYQVDKMRFGKKDNAVDKTTIVYSSLVIPVFYQKARTALSWERIIKKIYGA